MKHICPSCGADTMVGFSGKSREFGIGDYRIRLESLSGERCTECEEIIYSDESSDRIADALDAISKKRNGDFLKHVRKERLNLTQKEAVRMLSGGGHNAFSRYENGEVSIPKPLLILMHLLDKNPDLLNEVRGIKF